MVAGFKEAYNDINGCYTDLESDKITELNQLLKKRFGKNLFDADKKLIKKVKKIDERAKIRNEEEYRLLHAYLDSIEGVDKHIDEYNSLYKLYFDFETARSSTYL